MKLNKKIIIFVVFLLVNVSNLFPNGLPNAVIKIFSYNQSFNQRMPWVSNPTNQCSGSGFVIEGNIILTNAHVVSYTKSLEIKKQENPVSYIANIKYISHSLDLAILEVEDPLFYDDITPLKLGGIPKIDTAVKTVGFPMGGEKVSVTNGIISRIEKQTYAHTGVDEHLAIQTDAAINPGNSGGPVLQDNEVVGMAFQGISSGDNIGYMIPTTIIRQFIDDAKDNIINGIPEIGIYYNTLPPVMRDYLKLSPDESGIIVIATHPFSPANKIFRKNDILMKIDGYQISDDGSITMDDFRVPFYEVLERGQYGDEIEFVWKRDGNVHETKVKLTYYNRPLDIGSSYEENPPYLIFAGLSFVKLSGDYMRSFGKNWWVKIPPDFRLLYYHNVQLNKEKERECYIV